MKGNDIDNQVVPRLIVVWDGFLGVLPNKAAEAKFSTYLRFKRWKKAVGLYQINEPVATQVWDLTWRSKFSVDVVTFTPGDGFEEALADRLVKEDLPVGQVWSESPESLARSLSFRPSVACVLHANPQYVLTFGSKGAYAPDFNLRKAL